MRWPWNRRRNTPAQPDPEFVEFESYDRWLIRMAAERAAARAVVNEQLRQRDPLHEPTQPLRLLRVPPYVDGAR